jgi:hypothetical protein
MLRISGARFATDEGCTRVAPEPLPPPLSSPQHAPVTIATIPTRALVAQLVFHMV